MIDAIITKLSFDSNASTWDRFSTRFSTLYIPALLATTHITEDQHMLDVAGSKWESTMKKGSFLTSIILLYLISLEAAALTQNKPEKEKIRIGHTARTIAHSIPYMTNAAGLFRKENLDVKIVQTSSSIAPIALISTDVDFSIMSTFLLIPTSMKQGDIIMLNNFSAMHR